MHNRRLYKQAFAAFLAVLLMIMVSYCAFKIKHEFDVSVSVQGKIGLSLLSLSLGFTLYAKLMQTRVEEIASAWRYYLILLLSDIFVAHYFSNKPSIEMGQIVNVNALIIAGIISSIYMLYLKKYTTKKL